MSTPRPTHTVWETAVAFGGERGLIGVVTEPSRAGPSPDDTSDPGAARADAPADGALEAGGDLAVVVLNAGITPRVGPARLGVRIARALAARGLVTLRFDHSQTGDSKVARTGRGARDFDDLDAEAIAALDHLQATRGLRRFVLTGLCAGAAGALRVAALDPRVVAAVPLGLPPIRDAGGQRFFIRHVLRLVTTSSFRARKWRALLRLDFDVGRVLSGLATAPFGALSRRDRDDDATETGALLLPDPRVHLGPLLDRGVPLLLVHAEGDEGLDATLATVDPDLLHPPGDEARLHVIRGANHVFTLASAQAALLDLVVPWIAGLPERLPPEPP